MIRRLDIGCGNTIIPGYERADIDPNCPDLDFICPMDAIPVEAETFGVVRASHCIEHLPIDGARKALREWLRVLGPGGVAIIDTPNIDRNVDLYRSGDWMRDFNTLTPSEQQRCSMNGEPNAALWLNFKCFSTEVLWNVHYFNATPDLLCALCIEAGFASVEVVQTDPSLIVHARK